MTTEHVSPENLDAPRPEAQQPAAPPADYIPVDLLPADALERIEHLLSQEQKDVLEKARIAQRDQKRAAAAKAKEESAASSARAKAAVDELVAKDKETPEDEKPETKPGAPAFELEVPDTLTPTQQKVAAEIAEDVAAIATSASIPQTEAQVILDTALDIAATIMPNGEEPNLANESECRAVMEHRWGIESTKGLVADANKAVARLGADVRAWLNTPNEFGEVLGNSPAAIYALAMYQRGVTSMTAWKATTELENIRKSPEYQRGDKIMTDKVALLTKIATRFQSRELPAPSPKPIPSPQQVGRAKIEAAIAEIRKNPDYFSMDSKTRKPLVERMAALQAQLYGA